MPTINFLIQTDRNPATIYVRLREGVLIDCKVKTNYAIDPAYWDNGMEKIKGSKELKKVREQGISKKYRSAEGKDLNAKLSKLKSNLLIHYNNAAGKTEINSTWLKEFINPPLIKNDIPQTLVHYFDYYMLHRKSELKPSTYSKLGGIKNLIMRFEKDTRTTYLIKDVGADFKLKLERYCTKESYSPNTTARLFKFIKTIAYHAKSNGIETHFQLEALKVKFEDVNKVYLSFEDLKKIEKAKFDQDYLDNARDWLLISCETGQRVSDFMNFKKENIRKSKTGVPIIDFKQVKTGKNMGVPLSAKVVSILKKRKGDFPRKISDQNYNLYIKDVCKLAGITQKVKGSKIDPELNRKQEGTFENWELISSHVGRRSLSSNYYGIKPTHVLMYLTGHTTEAMFNEYVGKSGADQAEDAAAHF